MALVRDRENLLALKGARRFGVRDESKERANGGETSVAGLRRAGTGVLEMIEEVAEERHAEVLHAQMRWLPRQALRREEEQQSESAAVGSDGMRARTELRSEAVGEKALEEGREIRRAHRASPRADISWRSVARRRSSGTAWKYQ